MGRLVAMRPSGWRSLRARLLMRDAVRSRQTRSLVDTVAAWPSQATIDPAPGRAVTTSECGVRDGQPHGQLSLGLARRGVLRRERATTTIVAPAAGPLISDGIPAG